MKSVVWRGTREGCTRSVNRIPVAPALLRYARQSFGFYNLHDL